MTHQEIQDANFSKEAILMLKLAENHPKTKFNAKTSLLYSKPVTKDDLVSLLHIYFEDDPNSDHKV